MRPIIGRDVHQRPFCHRTCESAFGTRFYADSRRRLGLDLDYVVGAFVVGVVTALLLGIVL